MEYTIYRSSDFQCPITGVPVLLVFDEQTYTITAEICTLIWGIEHEFYDFDLTEETQKWCSKFHMYAANLDEANKIAESFDCWFGDAI